mmetsp:Transcript_19019/g.33852  ORF Transcript_19019/g.33852 Transcript_19019/m.33852 type:complete len:223 (-) Transcript_19019:354-1022(-)
MDSASSPILPLLVTTTASLASSVAVWAPEIATLPSLIAIELSPFFMCTATGEDNTASSPPSSKSFCFASSATVSPSSFTRSARTASLSVCIEIVSDLSPIRAVARMLSLFLVDREMSSLTIMLDALVASRSEPPRTFTRPGPSTPLPLEITTRPAAPSLLDPATTVTSPADGPSPPRIATFPASTLPSPLVIVTSPLSEAAPDDTTTAPLFTCASEAALERT